MLSTGQEGPRRHNLVASFCPRMVKMSTSNICSQISLVFMNFGWTSCVQQIVMNVAELLMYCNVFYLQLNSSITNILCLFTYRSAWRNIVTMTLNCGKFFRIIIVFCYQIVQLFIIKYNVSILRHILIRCLNVRTFMQHFPQNVSHKNCYNFKLEYLLHFWSYRIGTFSFAWVYILYYFI